MGGQKSDYGVLFYNYLREIAEEFFDLDDVIDDARGNHLHLGWMLSLGPIRRVLDEVENGDVELRPLSAVVSPFDGSLSFLVLAYFRSPNFYDELRKVAEANWKAKHRIPGGAPIEFVTLESPKIDEWVDTYQLGYGSVVAIDLARTYIANLQAAAC